MELSTPFTEQAGVEVPLICGAMYPCSNPELVAAASNAGGLGVVQPVSMIYVHGHEFREGLRFIRRLTDRPIGMNALIEQSSRVYRERMERWIDVALAGGAAAGSRAAIEIGFEVGFGGGWTCRGQCSDQPIGRPLSRCSSPRASLRMPESTFR
jgi:NAD(P)H-dependent flavin oxidoreductase YrpB (nitropropane dioxygenase family)